MQEERNNSPPKLKHLLPWASYLLPWASYPSVMEAGMVSVMGAGVAGVRGPLWWLRGHPFQGGADGQQDDIVLRKEVSWRFI